MPKTKTGVRTKQGYLDSSQELNEDKYSLLTREHMLASRKLGLDKEFKKQS